MIQLSHHYVTSPQSHYLPQQSDDRKFHLLIRQSLLNLPINALLETEPLYHYWFNQIQILAPEIWQKANTEVTTDYIFYYQFQGSILWASCDLLIANSHSVHLHQWRNLDSLPKSSILQDWSTRLRLFLLVDSLNYLPENVAITYWFLTKFKVVKLTLNYQQKLHQEFQEIFSKYQNLLPFDANKDTLTDQFLQGKLSLTEYIDAIPEVEI